MDGGWVVIVTWVCAAASLASVAVWLWIWPRYDRVAEEALAETGEFDVLDAHFASAQAALAALLPPRPLTPMEQWELRLIERDLLADPDLRAVFDRYQT